MAQMDFINSIVMILSFKIYAIKCPNISILWHKQLGHFNHHSLIFLVANHLAKGIPFIPMNTTWKSSYNVMSGLTKNVNAKLHNHWNSYDLCRMIKTTSMGGAHYFMTFINNYNHYTWVYFLKFNSQAY
jgi:hypothetical protein